MRLAPLLLVLLFCTPALAGGVLDRVRRDDVVRCAAPPEQLGFAMPEGRTGNSGFDVDLCRAIAAAVLGDGGKSQFYPLPATPRLAGLKDGTLDVLTRDTAITLSRSFDAEVQPVAVSFYTGLGIMFRAQTNILSLEALDGASICLRRDPDTTRILAAQMALRGFKYRAIEADSFAEATRAFFANKCDALLGNQLDLATARTRTDNPGSYRVASSLLTLDSYGPVVARGDPQWAEIVRWTLHALIAAETLNVSQLNLKDAVESRDRAVRRLLGREGDPGAPLGLKPDWVANVIAAVGNYGDIFDRNLGPAASLGLARGLNEIWFRGGMLNAPTFQ